MLSYKVVLELEGVFNTGRPSLINQLLIAAGWELAPSLLGPL